MKCEDLEKIWGKGNILGAPAEASSIAYTTQYTVKKAYELEKDWPEGFEKPFILMSRRPGLGAEYIEIKKPKEAIYINGAKSLPRYAKAKFEKAEPKEYQEMIERGKRIAKQYEAQDVHMFNTSRRSIIGDTKEGLKKAKLKERRDKL